MRYLTLAIAACLGCATAALAAPLGTTFTYQGQLNDNGAPANANYDFQFALFTGASGGTAVSTVELDNQTVSAGLINASLDFTDTPFDGQALWIEVHVRSAGSGTFTTLAPRQAINATPYALYALSAPGGGTVLTLPFSGSGSDPNAAFSATNTGSGNGIVGLTASSASGVYGSSTSGSGYGVAGRSGAGSALGAPAGTGVLGDSDTGYGLLGLSAQGDGVHGHTGFSGTGAFAGVAGEGDGGNYGVYGSSGSGTGVFGTSIDGDGVHGHTSHGGSAGTASGVAGLGDGSNFGVYGSSGDFVGVFGTSLNGWGVQANNTGSCNSAAQFCTSTLLVTNSEVGDLINAQAAGTYVFRVNGNGAVFANGGYNTGGADVAEYVPATQALAPGDVVEIDGDVGGEFRLASSPSSTAVAGVISTLPGLTMNTSEAAGEAARGEPRLALTGRVPVKVSAENGAIRAGDLLVSSSTPGRAMRAPANPQPGTVIGKAMQRLDDTFGEVEMLVMLR